MKCSLCQQNYDPRDCGMLEIDRCRDCLLKNMITDPCEGTCKRMCDRWDCKKCFLRSFAADPRCKYWDYQMNDCWPIDAFRSTATVRYFTCHCGHDFNKATNTITVQDSWCPFCCDPPLKLCSGESCNSCFSNSFASSKRAEAWSATNKKAAREVFKSSTKKYTFDCTCGHSFPADPLHVSQGTWCPYCSSPPKKLCDKECDACFNRSFASHPRSAFLTKPINTRALFKGTHVVHEFKCQANHTWSSPINKIVDGHWCPHCKNKTEKKLGEWLTTNYTTVLQPRFEWCRRKQKLPFDFQVDKWIIELDGGQHFKDVAHFMRTTEEEQENDVYKMRKALENGYGVIRVVQTEVYGDTWDWQSALILALAKPAQNVQYLSKNASTYDTHKALMLK